MITYEVFLIRDTCKVETLAHNAALDHVWTLACPCSHLTLLLRIELVLVGLKWNDLDKMTGNPDGLVKILVLAWDVLFGRLVFCKPNFGPTLMQLRKPC